MSALGRTQSIHKTKPSVPDLVILEAGKEGLQSRQGGLERKSGVGRETIEHSL